MCDVNKGGFSLRKAALKAGGLSLGLTICPPPPGLHLLSTPADCGAREPGRSLLNSPGFSPKPEQPDLVREDCRHNSAFNLTQARNHRTASR